MKRQMTATMTSNPLADLIEAAQLFVSRIACGDTHREAELSSGITAEVARTCAHLRRGGLEHIIFVPEASTTAASFGESSRGADVTIVSADIEVSANAPTLPIAVREAALAWCDQYALAFLAES